MVFRANSYVSMEHMAKKAFGLVALRSNGSGSQAFMPTQDLRSSKAVLYVLPNREHQESKRTRSGWIMNMADRYHR
ncbi:hypothetical protein T07_4534 [Trichinella nelsoni]|uniref:Uncharacterized protein n=1 Tax=Trichinella nelsoni TaxID=6336 RepID=A0A0V0S492_9BILA|nr:hypothetical protein T07_4534 [Trichinella nelsoni]